MINEWLVSEIWRGRRKQILLFDGSLLLGRSAELFLVSACSILLLQNVAEGSLVLLLFVVHAFDQF